MQLAIHVREHRSLLAEAEKRLLIRLAGALPRSIHSDHLSILALVSMLVAGGAFAAMRIWPGAAAVVVLALAVNWFGDSLDGTVARVRGCQRPRFGFYVDHATDLLGTVALFIGIACSGLMAPTLAIGVLSGYLLVCAESFLGTHATGVFRMSAWGVGPTELRIVLAIGAVCAASGASLELPWLGRVRPFDVGGVVAVIGLAVTFLVAFARQTRLLSRLEPRITAVVLILLLAIPMHARAQGSSVGPIGAAIRRAATDPAMNLGPRPHPYGGRFCCNMKGIVIGAAIGAALGAWASMYCDGGDCAFERFRAMSAGAGLGALIGAFAEQQQRVTWPSRGFRLGGALKF